MPLCRVPTRAGCIEIRYRPESAKSDKNRCTFNFVSRVARVPRPPNLVETCRVIRRNIRNFETPVTTSFASHFGDRHVFDSAETYNPRANFANMSISRPSLGIFRCGLRRSSPLGVFYNGCAICPNAGELYSRVLEKFIPHF